MLISAGLDSAVLAAAEARTSRVHPIYVATGLAWEVQERAALEQLLSVPPLAGRTAPPATLSFTVSDLYPATHWALRGRPPAFDTPDEDVYLVGRNVALLSKAAIHCAQHRITRILLGPLAGNPFPDASPEFFDTMARALSLGLAHPIDIATPFASMEKSEVIRLGVELGVPLELTLSCMNPPSPLRGYGEASSLKALHCGECSKCRERRDAFRVAAVADPTTYETVPVR